ncbi:rod shape-determining protein [Mediterraneibacter sp. NSJ-151]|uniref:Cell shape-determining protein MreB n=1 Tax=Ruminococcus hominis TaxID=2763065 RepID=A0ABR7G936_9FIRM|nr:MULTISPECIES: rod shape-determining protein [Clostridia]MBC5683301.1 rod shape-determining protein [Ruminococcus hominis]MCH4279154.1 rod shape-determining protein [Mediterraneibacter sp. NSJ-151]
MAGNIYGLDLGTYEIKVYDERKDEIWKEKSAIATKNQTEIFAVGDEAYAMYEKAPQNIEVLFPMQGGVIARFCDMQNLLENLLRKRQFFGSEYVIAIPTDITEVEKRAFYDLVYHSSARAKSVSVVERGIADAIGCKIDVYQTGGVMILNMGGGTMELSVLAYGGIVMNRLLKFGGEQFDQEIINLVRRNRDFLIGRKTAEQLRRTFGIFSEDTKSKMQIAGRNLILGLPQRTDISIGLVRAALKEQMDDCVDAIQTMIQRIPPDVLRELKKNGIYLTGGMANLRGIAEYLEESVGVRVSTVDYPELCSMNGLREIIQDKKRYGRLTYSMLDKGYRWLE